KLLGLGYPGGPILDRLAKLGDAQAIPFKLPLVKRGKNFTSFSGLKTAVVDYARENKLEEILKKRPIEECPQALNLIASFQKTVAKIVDRLMQHLSTSLNAKRWAITGGVACNSEIRSRLGESAKKLGVELFIPRPKFCTDNASMIALVGHAYLSKGLKSDIDLNATATESRMPT
ncbi:MAG: tRNA (adenosine(37)-N6)-threonylcarbamoyltransferase complex transferase subunit TsaD, partial [Deltaproteobacteria bacterium]|nr:tRNA (adenosine(37)-N6)-threonylcarbamoyltransferase complex transferase subunit TsaD [Deltaproteobacteria bacterium]